ncbi:hypothetical protein [Corallococcus carmarthensis]|uniref:hypothetical protein n=1 Tax=Corallococcus carmarthensis TaxID=2316728 RepID=UPI003F659A15
MGLLDADLKPDVVTVNARGHDVSVLRAAASSDVGVALTAVPRRGMSSPRIDYTLTVTQHGPDPLARAVITVALPPGLLASTRDCQMASGALQCEVGPLAVGDTALLRFSAPLPRSSLGLSYRITATRTLSIPADLQSANDVASQDYMSLGGLAATW